MLIDMSAQEHVMGLDPGFRNVGVVIAAYPDMSIIYENTYTAAPSNTHTHYLTYLADLFSRFNPSAVAIEKPFFTTKTLPRNVGTLEFIGILKLLCEKHSLTLSQYSPTEIKKSATGSGVADKAQMVSAAKELFNCSFSSHHSADAACIAKTYWDKRLK